MNEELKEQLLELLEQRKLKQVKTMLEDLHMADIAEIIEEFAEDHDCMIIFRLLPKDVGAEVFSYLSSETQQVIVTKLNDSEIGYIVDDLYSDDAIDFIDEMPANLVEKILKSANKQTRDTINKLLSYKEGSAGSVMTTEFVDLKKDMTTTEAFARIRKLGEDVETIETLYVTDKKRELLGVLSIKELILANPEETIENIMTTNPIYANTSTDQEELSLMFNKYDLYSLPIVDGEDRLVGIVTIDDIMEITIEETTEDIEKMAGITPTDKPYLKTSIFKTWLNRIPWLLLLMLSATFTGLIITNNEAVLNQSEFGIILTACIPMIMGTGGNAGGQASATVIRGITLNEISFKDSFRVLWKEARISILCGATLAVACFGKLLFIDGLFGKESGLLIAAIVSAAMLITIVLAKLVGCFLPLLAKKIHLDPAVMASPFITTIVDVLSLLIFCNLAIALL